jgi:hypothetical protein
MKVEAVVEQVSGEFAIIFDVQVFTTLRPASQSTPMGKDASGKVKNPIGPSGSGHMHMGVGGSGRADYRF